MNSKSTQYNKIIFIDDDIELISFYDSILQQKNLSEYFLHFENAKEGIDYIANCDKAGKLPNYVLLDLYMPKMNGFQFLKQLSKIIDINSHMEIFVCSSSQLKDDRDKVMKYPFVSAYLEKPITSDFIELLIEDIF